MNILSSFEDRLCKLQDTILPVHKETTDLQRRQESIFSNSDKKNEASGNIIYRIFNSFQILNLQLFLRHLN